MKFKIRFVDQIVGFFVLVAIVGIAVILIFIGLNQRWFGKNYYFKTAFPSGENLSVGMPIMLQGFAIGKVSGISLTPDNTVDVDFFVQDVYYDRILPYSVIEVVSSPIGIGGTSMKLHPGKKGSGLLPEHSQVPSINSAEGKDFVERGLVEMPSEEDVIGSVLEKVNPVLDDVRSTLATIKRLSTDLDQAITGKGGPLGDMVNSLAKTPDKLNDTIDRINGAVDTINNRVDRISTGFNGVADRVNTAVGKIDTVAESLKVITANLAALSEGLKDSKGLVTRLLDPKGSIATLLNDDNKLYSQIQDALASVKGSVADIKSFTDYLNTAKPQISALLEKGSTTLDQGNDVLEAVKNNPLLKGGVPEAKTQGSTTSGYRDEDF
jgi:phospholipid/cholesterol/gamma-HCH transport system substrate-binding protein